MTKSTATCPPPLFDTLEHLNKQRTLTHVPPSRAGDFDLAYEFIFSYRGSEATFNAYRREIERLLHWSWSVSKKSIKQLQRTDIEAFLAFCQNPPLDWIGTKNVKRFTVNQGERVPNDTWRPFVASGETSNYALSQKALQAIFSILGSFYTFLIEQDYVAMNPVAQIRQKSRFFRKQQNKAVVRRLSELQWAYVIETTEQLAEKDPDKHERTLFILNALFGMYLRISELAASERWTPQMGDFHKDSDGHWWFTTVGKGNKERDIAVSDAMLEALKRYRHHLGLPALPSLGENTFLIVKANGKGPINSTRQIRSIVQGAFDAATERMKQDGFHEEADQLQAATVHWLRHTGISEDVKHRPREHVRDDAGHGSSAITDRYIDVELRERHASSRKKKIKPE